MSTVDLDDIALLQSMDPGEMARRISELPAQCWEARALAQKYLLPEDYRRAEAIVILGLGGSAIGGDLVRALVLGECQVPIFVSRDYELPAFVNSRTLVVASSYSGNTEETLAAFQATLERGAMPLAITTGGQLGEICKRKGLPHITFGYESQPRAALGYSLVILLTVLQQLGYVTESSTQLDAAIEAIEQLQAQIALTVPEASNPAKQLARRLAGRLAIFYGGGHLAEVARRWKCQLNENSKSWAFWEAFPELNHNAVVGYEFPESLAPNVHVLILASDLYHARHQVRMGVTGEILAQKGIAHEVLQVKGRTHLSQLLWAIHLGDFVSYYLAALCGADPTPVATIDYLKQRLGQTP
jgi:glucose/mannose-6-phosphate isomerase